MNHLKTIPELLDENKDRVSISLEILPPVRGNGIKGIFNIIDEIKDTNPLWIDVTSHSSSIEWIPDDNANMIYRRNKRRKTPGTIAICGAIKYKYNIPAVPHVLCYGFTREETEDALIDLDYLGVNNILAIRGDGTQGEKRTLHGNNNFAVDLIKQITNMNEGIYLDQNAAPTNFCVGGACYPEKHLESPNLEECNERLLEKQNEGAKYTITQMFFNNEKFLSFYDSIKDKLNIPVIPGLKIIITGKQINMIPKHFFVEVPQEFVNSITKAESPEEAQNAGIDWAFNQCVNLIENGHNHLHFYIMRNTSYFLRLIERLNEKYKFIK